MQYDDGVPWDEAIADEEIADQLGWSQDGLLSEDYELIGPGPTLADASEAHDWFPTPDQLWDTADQMARNLYPQFVRCKRCGLSGEAAIEHARGTWPPTMCAVCDATKPAEVSYLTETYRDEPVCADCVAEEDLQVQR